MTVKSYDPRDVEAVEYTHELLERDRQRLGKLEVALRVRFNIPEDQAVKAYLAPRIRSGEIGEDAQIEDWLCLWSTVEYFDTENW